MNKLVFGLIWHVLSRSFRPGSSAGRPGTGSRPPAKNAPNAGIYENSGLNLDCISKHKSVENPF